MGKLGKRIGLLCLLVVGLGHKVVADQTFDARGVNRFRGSSGLLPGEHIDPLTGGLSLNQVDLVLPGPAGFDLVIQRSYSSKFLINPGTLSEYIDWYGWTGVGWSLHMGRVRDADGAAPGPVEMADGSQHVLYPRPSNPDGFGWFITKELWIYDQGSQTLRLPNGTKYSFGQCAALGPVGQLAQFRYATRIADAFDNPIDVYYGSPAASCAQPTTDVISSIVQTINPSQTRTVTFTASSGQLASMTYSGRTWNYTHIAVSSRPRLMTVLTPVGTQWNLTYYSNHELNTQTTPNGGTVTYAYVTKTFKLGINSNYNVPTRAVVTRSTGGRDIVAGSWTYAYGQGAGENQTVITDPVGKTTTTFLGVGNYSSQGNVWSIGLPSTVVRSPSTGPTMETTTNEWMESVAISELDVSIGYNSDPDVFAPLLSKRTVAMPKASGSDTLITDYSYNLTNFNDYAQPFRVTMTSNKASVRTRESVYKHDFSLYIRGRQTSEKSCAASACSGSNGFASSWTYSDIGGIETTTPPTVGFLKSRTSNGVTMTFTPTAQGDVGSQKLGGGQPTNFTYDSGQEKDRETPLYTILRAINPEGTVASETRRGFITSFLYDAVFRLTTVTPHTIQAFPSAPTTTTYNKSGVREVSTTTTRGNVSTTTTVDGFGRPRLSTNAEGVKAETTYDSLGRKATATLPYEGTPATIPKDTFTYDELDRLERVQHQDSTFIEYTFDGLKVSITDEEGKTTIQEWEAFGSPQSSQLVQVTEPNAGFGAINTYYLYNALGSLWEVNYGGGIGASGPVRSWSYFLPNEAFSGLLKSETHPESGTTSYLYYPTGNLKSRTESNARVTTNTYDNNSRLTNVTYSDNAPYDVTIGYDDSDNRTSYLDSFAQQSQAFDAVNRLTSRTETVGGRSFTTGFEYDPNDRLRHITYPAPSGRHVYYSYDNANRVSLAANAALSPTIVYANDFLYHPSGALKEFRPNGGVSPKQVFTHHPTRYWLDSVNTGLRALGYGYDDVGNVMSIGDTRSGMNRSFTYDDLHRLKTATGFWGGGAKTYTYDNYGNRTNDPMANTSSWLYDSKFRLTRPSSSGVATLGYNALGNLASDPQFTYTYTPANLIETVTAVGGGAIATYRYDADGQRLLKVQGGSKAFFVHGPAGETLTEASEPCPSAPLQWTKDTIYAGGRLLAWLKPDVTQPTVAWQVSSSAASESGSATIQAVLTTSTPLGCPVTVTYAVEPGTATLFDIVTLGGTLVFPAGAANGALQAATIALANDLLDEDDSESFTVALTNAVGADIAGAAHTVSITDNDPLPTVSVANNPSVLENAGLLVFTVSLSPVSGRTVSVVASTAPGTASLADYVTSTQVVTFAAGETSKAVSIGVIDDAIYEPAQTVLLGLSSPTNAVVGVAQGTGTVLDNDLPPSFSIADVSVAEGNAGSTNLGFVVSLSALSEVSALVNWSTANGSATAESGDYVASSGSLAFLPGQQQHPVGIAVNGDLLFEPDENLLVNLSLPASANATIADGQAVGTITNDDTQAPIVTTSAATFLTESTATLNGTVNPNGLPTTGFHQYGQTTGYGNTSPSTSMGSGVTPVALNTSIADLACNTLFHFRAVATNSVGTVNGADNTFTTAACPPPPTVTTVAATGITQTGGTLNGLINPNAGATKRRFEYGLTTAYGLTSPSPDIAIGAGSSNVSVAFVATGLACNTTYHYRAVGYSNGGTVNGSDMTFTSAACPPAGSGNISPATARSIAAGSSARDILNTVRTELWYRVQLFADRSYQFSAWAVDEDGAAGVSPIVVSLFSDSAGVVPAMPAPISVNTDLEGSPNSSTMFAMSTLFLPTAAGVYRLRVLGAPGAADTSLNVMVRETTLFSPWFFVTTSSGYDSYHEIHNNTDQPVTVTLKAVGATGVQLGVTSTFTLTANATVARSTQVDLMVTGDGTTGGTLLMHTGAFGAISANTTTLSTQTGLSYDSPFAPRSSAVAGLPIR